MNVKEINEALSLGVIDKPGLFPRLNQLKQTHFVFDLSFGLDTLPEKPGLILIRGARQYGKSTWLEQELRSTIKKHGPGSAYYLNGDELPDSRSLATAIRELIPLFSTAGNVKRLFIDEITAIKDWEKGLKQVLDQGELREILVVTTGSKATDLRRGAERLPGRKGKLERTSFVFTPISFNEFRRVCGKQTGDKTLLTYLLSGGCPIACNELVSEGRLPEYVATMVHDWVYGEFAASGRERSSVLAVMDALFRYGGTAVGHAKLAREGGFANNTVVAGYIEFLGDLLTVAPSYAWDKSHQVIVRRRPCKFHFTNLLVATCFSNARLRTVHDFENLPEGEQAKWFEWIIAQELWRRAARRGEELPELFSFWQTKEHEIDFVLDATHFLEVKRGSANPLHFSWFPGQFPKEKLTIVNKNRFDTPKIKGITFEDFLSEVD